MLSTSTRAPFSSISLPIDFSRCSARAERLRDTTFHIIYVPDTSKRTRYVPPFVLREFCLLLTLSAWYLSRCSSRSRSLRALIIRARHAGLYTFHLTPLTRPSEHFDSHTIFADFMTDLFQHLFGARRAPERHHFPLYLRPIHLHKRALRSPFCISRVLLHSFPLGPLPFPLLLAIHISSRSHTLHT
ncbi:hypothetical protein EXIGLDRAFT_263385 [Exidia glandulosa HHB12029]|uniref:Uncharacterized protein n=1 Tax=Exidia glandulosa HHB12029 TaxID=1314781 RepID=A0A165DRV9_EXIGL|nr:hypothetical protein EXIGLDRAFT_263385 [Exidia glandulosa HHB12029]